MKSQGFFDTHCHLIDQNYNLTPEEIIDNAKRVGVTRMVNVCTALEEADKIIQLAINNRNNGVYASVGIHPNLSMEALDTEEELQNFTFLAKNNCVVGIGECGLDYYRETNKKQRKIQQKVFALQIKIAQQLDKPLIIHCRDAFDDCYEMLKKYTTPGINPTGVMHCYTGTYEMAQKFIKLGFLISFAGNLTFKNAGNLVKVCEKISLEHIVIETDSPYLAPDPHRGRTNYPNLLPITAKRLAHIKHVDLEEIIKITEINACHLFRI